jgi:hypothetical protein
LLLDGDLHLLLLLFLLQSHLIAILVNLLFLAAFFPKKKVRCAIDGQPSEATEYHGFNLRVHFLRKI